MPPEPIRVCNVLFQSQFSGAPRVAVQVGTRVDPARFEVELLCGGEGEITEAARAGGLRARTFPAFTMDRIHPRNDARSFWDLYRLFRRERYDVVHTHSSKAGIIGRLAARMAGTPAILHTYQGFEFDSATGAKAKVYEWLARLAGRFSHALIFVNDDDIATARSRKIGRPDTYVRLTNGIDLDAWQPVDPEMRATIRKEWMGDRAEHGKLVVFVGRLMPQKAPADFVEAARLLADRQPDAVFLVVGDGALEDSLAALVAEHGLGDRVKLGGWRRDVPDILRAADCFTLPSLWEGLPLILLWSMAARLPVVATDIKGNRELVEHEVTGLLCPPGDPAALAGAIDRLLADEVLGARLTGAARRRIEAGYSLTAVVASVERLYEDLVASGRPVRFGA